jgi:hypothetical protein
MKRAGSKERRAKSFQHKTKDREQKATSTPFLLKTTGKSSNHPAKLIKFLDYLFFLLIRNKSIFGKYHDHACIFKRRSSGNIKKLRKLLF